MTLPARAVAILTGLCREEGAAPRGDGNFRGRLARAIGVVAAQGVDLAVGMEPLAILVAFVGRDEYGGAGVINEAQALEDVDRAEDVGLPGLDGLFVRETDEWLGGEVEYEIRSEIAD